VSWEIGYRKTFLKDLKKIPTRERYAIEIFAFEVIPHIDNPLLIKGIEKLSGYEKFYKKRFGDYRLGLELDAMLEAHLDNKGNVLIYGPNAVLSNFIQTGDEQSAELILKATASFQG
jgi:mRNA interferase RelE/StbE